MNSIQAGMTGAEAQAVGARILEAAGIKNPRTDARILLAAASGVERHRLVLMGDQPLSEDTAKAYAAALKQRANREPISHIIGQREFYGRRFIVNADVLDPRPDTETLVELALGKPFGRVLDLGTGSGCILLTLLAERSKATGVGTDVSPSALSVAMRNSAALAVDDRADFLVSDWFGAVDGRFDLIVTNPPYIAESEMSGLEPELRDHEPRVALTPGGDGLGAYRAISAGISGFLTAKGRVLMEIGPTQAQDVCTLLDKAGLVRIFTHRDIDGRDRVVEAFAND